MINNPYAAPQAVPSKTSWPWKSYGRKLYEVACSMSFGAFSITCCALANDAGQPDIWVILVATVAAGLVLSAHYTLGWK